MRWPRRYPVLRETIVNLKGGTVFRGVVWGRRGGYLVLRNARMLRADGQAAGVGVDGEVAVPEANVDFLQVVT
jgi:hypothetical protein